MASRISPGLVADIRFAIELIQEHGTTDDALKMIDEIVSRRLGEIEGELAERSDSTVITLSALQNALQNVAAELESVRHQPQ